MVQAFSWPRLWSSWICIRVRYIYILSISIHPLTHLYSKYYEDGIGVAPDFPRALEYFGKAASKGYQPAAEKLNRPMADGSRRKRTLKKDEQGHAANGSKFIPVVVSLPRVKQDDDDDDDNDTRHKLNANSNGNNICTIQW